MKKKQALIRGLINTGGCCRRGAVSSANVIVWFVYSVSID